VSKPAPGRLRTVQQFVNSTDLEHGPDQLASPEALAEWLRSHDLLEAEARATKGDLARALALREALRGLLLGHHGDDHEPDPAAAAVLDDAARRARVALRFGGDGHASVAPAAAGVDGALGRILGIVAAAQADGTWERLKACPWETCGWAFYDATKNRSGVWCNMAVCGNRAKARAHRERQRTARSAGASRARG
jgi:predicted RNA-binding Zn ribbon-like protein